MNGGSGRLPLAKTALRSWTWYGQGAMNGPKIADQDSSKITRNRPDDREPVLAQPAERVAPQSGALPPAGEPCPGRRSCCVAIVAGLLAVPDPGVDVGVQHVDHDVEERDRESVEHGHRHEQAVVARRRSP